MEAERKEDVGGWLSDRGYLIVDVTEASFQTLTSRPIGRRIRVSRKEMNFFLIQLSSLISAGCPLLMSLTALHKQVSASSLKILLKDIKEKIESGKSFSEALKVHKLVFPPLFITMVEVGEVGGMLDEVLVRYSQLFDTAYKLRSKVVQAMIYPSILLIATVLVAWALLVFVFPTFVEGTKRTGKELPGLTKLVLYASNFLSDHWIAIIAVFLFSIFIWFIIRSTRAGRRLTTSAFLSVPILRDILKHIQISLFARVLGTLLRCGVPILTSLQAVENALSNVIFREAVADVREGISRGESLSQAVGRHRNLFPESVILMADVGERGGNMGEMLEKVGNIYERDMELSLETAVTLIQPALVVFLAIFIVIIAMAMYLPLFDIVNTIG